MAIEKNLLSYDSTENETLNNKNMMNNIELEYEKV